MPNDNKLFAHTAGIADAAIVMLQGANVPLSTIGDRHITNDADAQVYIKAYDAMTQLLRCLIADVINGAKANVLKVNNN